MKLASAVVAAVTLAGLESASYWIAQAQESPAVAYPSEYRSWAMVKTFVITAESKLFKARGGFHHYFANDKALEGYRTGKFPEGSVIVDEGVSAKEDGGVTVETTVRSVEVMRKDPRYQATGGWGYERFEGESTAGSGGKAEAACFACHTGAKARDYVFSTSRLSAASKKQ
ncbi:MAG: cytochrome P460 family protein [Chloroflexia bacterium]